ncbi:uncharacterized protein LOC133797915 [Humulus lupulus]|uniref:uncharacterized protein LOC133797915 n=1 Tax=Humulus lupulus TaxID=3486 RepID=UPI002B409F80|nr:uncharacterized protein LOC133797915 [Humulus lupulus]
MSVFGGDSWGKEAQFRKRRVEDLLVESPDGSSFKKLSNGKFACLVCPHSPILDSPLMFPTHCKGSKHQAAESRLKEREATRTNDINKKKRIDLAECPSRGNLLSETARNLSARERRSGKIYMQTNSVTERKNINQNQHETKLGGSVSQALTVETTSDSHLDIGVSSFPNAALASKEAVEQWCLDYRERKERELKFTAAGWKRDCHGKWYKDESAEFDSDEEDPNVCLG